MKITIQKYRMISILTILMLIITFITLTSLYAIAISQQKARLIDITRTQALLIEAVADFDQEFSRDDLPQGATQATLSQVEKAFKEMQGFGVTGEIMLIQHHDQMISIITSNRMTNNQEAIKFPENSPKGNLYKSVGIGHSGVITGSDHNGIQVITAFTPVSNMGYSVVSKINLAEIREPYIKAAIALLVFSGALILIGSKLFGTMITPIVNQITDKEEKLRLLLNATAEPIYGIDLEGRCTFANPICAKQLGYNHVSDLIDKDMHALTHYAHKDKSRYLQQDCKIYKAQLKSEILHVDDEVFWKKDGTAIPVEYHSQPIYKEGKIIGTVVTFKDLSEKIKAQQSIVESEQKYRTTFEKAFVGITHVSLEGRFIEMNQCLCDITGYSKQELMTMTFMDITHKDDLDDDLDQVEALLSGKNDRYTIEKRYIHKDGHEVWVELMATLLKNSDGTPKNFISVINNITTKKRAEAALKKAQEAHSQAEKITHFGSWDWDISTGDLVWTDEIYRIFGVKPQLFPATYEAFLNTTHPDDRQAVADAVNNAVADANYEYAIEHRVVRPNGEIRTVFEKGSIYRNDQGEATRMIGTVHDITEQKTAELELEKYKNQLEDLVKERTKELSLAQDELVRKERLATLGQLTATVSHELRNPLSAIRPSLYLIQKLSDSRNEKIQKALERINRNISRCDNIIDELLDFTRIKTLETQPIQLDEWLEVILHEQELPDNITLLKSLNLSKESIAIDSGRLRRAVVNVIENALHAMTEMPLGTGKQTLSVTTQHNKNRVEIIIKDSGVGMSEDVLKKVFEPLFSTKGFGVGLGMSAVKQIMKQHQGGIEISSSPGNGSAVTLWLPQRTDSDEANKQ